MLQTLENGLSVSYNVKHMHSIRPVIRFLGIYPRDLKMYVYTKTIYDCSCQLYL